MSSSLILFVVGIAVVGGVSAWIGDRLGHWVGKKRISKFGLRPRHTAMLYTVWTGVFIAVAVVFGLMKFDHKVQYALTQGPLVIAQNIMLGKQNRAQQLQIGKNNVMISEQQGTISGQESQIAEQKRQIAEVNKKYAAAQSNLAAMQGQLSKTETQLAATKDRLAGTQTQLARTAEKLGDTKVALGKSQDALRVSHGMLQEQGNDLRMVHDRLAAVHKRYVYFSAKADQLEARNIQLAGENSSLETKNKDLDRQRYELGADYAWIQGAPIAFHKSQEIGRKEFLTAMSPRKIRQQLQEFVTELSRTAQDNGLMVGKNGRAVEIVSMPVDTTNGSPAADLDEAANLDALADSIAALGKSVESVVVIAEAHNNTVRGEQVKIDLRPYDNVLVFQRGAVIATSVVDGSQSEDSVLASVHDFLVSQVKPAALKRGVIPTHDPVTNEDSVGPPIDRAEWTELVRQIRTMGSDAQVTAVARDDTYSKGPLRLTLTATAASGHTQRAMLAAP
jgi:uncharacterized protein (DUF3084 family)